MKYLKFVIVFLIFIISSCSKSTSYFVFVENNTKYNVQIIGFYNAVKIDAILIEPYDVYFDRLIYYEEPILLFERYHKIDSVNIVFDSNKVIVQSCDLDELRFCSNIEQNILDFDLSYEYDKKDNNSYTYVITDEDYERAVFIDSLENR